jgi:flagellin
LDGNPPTGWTQAGTGFTTASSAFVHAGVYGFGFDNNGAVISLMQTLATTPGQNYVIDFWYRTDPLGTFTPNALIPYFDGVALAGASGIQNAPGGWTHYSYQQVASTASTVLRFDATTTSGMYTAIDDIGVSAFSAGPAVIPLPSAALSGLLLFGGLIAARGLKRYARFL